MIIILMGVTGCGKTTVGQLLARECAMEFLDADDYHPKANVEKMRAGHPLNDDDRWPWLDRLNQLLRDRDREGKSVVLACSALKEVYRARLSKEISEVKWVWLHGDKALLAQRLAARKGHYMNPALLDSQFATLEPPQDALAVDVAAAPEVLVATIRKEINKA